MRAILTLAAVWLALAATPEEPRRYVAVPSSVPADSGVRPCPPSLSADGAFVAFDAHVSLDPADQNGRPDVYLLERASHRLTLVSRTLAGSAGRGSSRCPRLSDDGRRVVFEADAIDLVEGHTAGTTGVFLFDRIIGVLRRIAPMPSAGPAMSARPAISADGRIIVFDARPVDATPDQRLHVYRASLETPGDVEDLGEGHSATVSGNGRVVAFVTSPSTGGPRVIRVIGPALSRNVSPSAGQAAAEDVFAPTLSADGQWIAYVSRSGSIRIAGRDAARTQVYVERVDDGLRQLVSITPQGREANGYSQRPAIDATGGHVIFESTATNLGCDTHGLPSCNADINLLGDIFRWQRTTATVARVNVATRELPWLEGAAYPAVSPDGTSIAFLSRQPVSDADGRDTFDLFLTRAVNGDAPGPWPTRGGAR
jgi:Tol biopolymer transport system component